MRLCKALLLFFLPAFAYAVPLELAWDGVTLNVDGTPVAKPVQYKVYKQPAFGQWGYVWTTSNTRFTWLVPSLGRYTFRVTCIDANGTESDPSNELKIIVERIGREDK